jgi:hypothetical protein
LRLKEVIKDYSDKFWVVGATLPGTHPADPIASLRRIKLADRILPLLL